jgi:hypothetical protein
VETITRPALRPWSIGRQAWSALPLLVLLGAYLVLFVRVAPQAAGSSFDPLADGPRTVEKLIATGQFREALPVTLELHRAFPNEPQVSYWLATIQHGLGDPAAEARACQDYLRLAQVPSSGCAERESPPTATQARR